MYICIYTYIFAENASVKVGLSPSKNLCVIFPVDFSRKMFLIVQSMH